jgi:CBS domain-containing protein
MLAKDVMSDGVLSVGADASVREAAKLLVNCGVSAMPVVDAAGIMVGIVSEADLMAEAADYAPRRDDQPVRTVAHVMTKEVVSASAEMPIADVAHLMKASDIKRLPVLAKGAVVGIVSRIDVLRALISLSDDVEKGPPALRPDEELRREVHAVCQGRSWSVAKQLDVVVNRGVAHLWGMAPTSIVQQAYRVAAENVPGIKTVRMHMHVVPPSTTPVASR